MSCIIRDVLDGMVVLPNSTGLPLIVIVKLGWRLRWRTGAESLKLRVQLLRWRWRRGITFYSGNK